MQEGTHPPVPQWREELVVRVEVIEGEKQGHQERGQHVYEIGWLEVCIDQDDYQRPLDKDSFNPMHMSTRID